MDFNYAPVSGLQSHSRLNQLLAPESPLTQARTSQSMSAKSNVYENKSPGGHHLYWNDDGSRKRGFRNRSFQGQDTIHRNPGHELGGVYFSWKPEKWHRRVYSTMTNHEKPWKRMFCHLIFQLSEHFRDRMQSKSHPQCQMLGCWLIFTRA